MDATALATILLVLVTGWYAFWTYRMAKSMEREREEMRRPVLSFQLISWNAALLKLRIQNVGSGAALDIKGTIESRLKSGSASFQWSHPFLNVGQYEEFGFPVPQDASTESRFKFENIRKNVLEVQAKFKYKSLTNKEYELDYSIPIEKVTDDWATSKMLVTEDHPDRIMPRIAKTLEEIAKELKGWHA